MDALGDVTDYCVNADPVIVGTSGDRHFHTDQSAIIRQVTKPAPPVLTTLPCSDLRLVVSVHPVKTGGSILATLLPWAVNHRCAWLLCVSWLRLRFQPSF